MLEDGERVERAFDLCGGEPPGVQRELLDSVQSPDRRRDAAHKCHVSAPVRDASGDDRPFLATCLDCESSSCRRWASVGLFPGRDRATGVDNHTSSTEMTSPPLRSQETRPPLSRLSPGRSLSAGALMAMCSGTVSPTCHFDSFSELTTRYGAVGSGRAQTVPRLVTGASRRGSCQPRSWTARKHAFDHRPKTRRARSSGSASVCTSARRLSVASGSSR